MDKEKIVWIIGDEPLVLTKTGNKKRSKSVDKANSKPIVEFQQPLQPQDEVLYNSILNCLGLSKDQP